MTGATRSSQVLNLCRLLPSGDQRIEKALGQNTKRLMGASVGLALVAVLIYESGPALILSDLKLIGGGLLAIIAIEFVVDFFNTLGWLFTLPPHHRRGQFGRLFLVRLAGYRAQSGYSGCLDGRRTDQNSSAPISCSSGNGDFQRRSFALCF